MFLEFPPERGDSFVYNYESAEDEQTMEFHFKVFAEDQEIAEFCSFLHMALILMEANIPQPWIRDD